MPSSVTSGCRRLAGIEPRAWPGDAHVDYVGVDVDDETWKADTYPFSPAASDDVMRVHSFITDTANNVVWHCYMRSGRRWRSWGCRSCGAVARSRPHDG